MENVGVHIWYLYYWEQREGQMWNPLALFELWLGCHMTIVIEHIQMFLSIQYRLIIGSGFRTHANTYRWKGLIVHENSKLTYNFNCLITCHI